jgi:site-specific recombinase XerD
VGALPSLSIKGTRWNSTTKGKEQSGTAPEEMRQAITKAKLPLGAPFEGQTAKRLKDNFRTLVRGLERAGRLKAKYSVHDLRHAYAVKLYKETKNIYFVKQALGHASVGVTETYLRSRGVKGKTA